MRVALLGAALAAFIAVPQPTSTDALAYAASRWASAFEEHLSGLLFRERYRQAADSGLELGVRLQVAPRTLTDFEANVFLIRVPGRDGFIVYRDVYRAGSQDVTDHTDRLQELLAANTADAFAQARRLTDASARFNTGSVTRNVNTPTMPFAYLTPENIGRLRLTDAGTDTINGVAVNVVAFDEVARPTLVRGERGADVPVSGRYWIDPLTGAVPRAVVEFQTAGGYKGRLDVRLTQDERLKTWVPQQMSEVWESRGSNASGIARYDRFTRVSVSTDEIVKWTMAIIGRSRA